jgi:hypothetical protein
VGILAASERTHAAFVLGAPSSHGAAGPTAVFVVVPTSSSVDRSSARQRKSSPCPSRHFGCMLLTAFLVFCPQLYA